MILALLLASNCAVERGQVKMLTDPQAQLVDLKTIYRTTVSDLAETPAPHVTPNAPRGIWDKGTQPADHRWAVTPSEEHWFTRWTQEFKVYELEAKIIVAKQEADSDIHLGLEDAIFQRATMIAESVDPDCAEGSLVLPQIKEVRAAILAVSGGIEPKELKTLIGKRVKVRGVGMFDVLHGQSAVAPNGIELHPMLSFEVIK